MTTEPVPQLTEETALTPPAPEGGSVQPELPVEDLAPGQTAQSEDLTQPAPTPTEVPAEPAPAPSEGTARYTPEQVAKMQQDAAQYEQVQMRATIQQQAEGYKKQLESQGFLPEHADHAANYYVQSQQQQINLMQQADQYGQHLHGKQVAAEHFAKQYNLGINDLAILRQNDTPEVMEAVAKKMSADRARDGELAQYRQAKVPAQSFDNSQGNPQVAADEGGWLDRYNGGDRSASAVAAARKAAGLG
jgi:hypothetical protein